MGIKANLVAGLPVIMLTATAGLAVDCHTHRATMAQTNAPQPNQNARLAERHAMVTRQVEARGVTDSRVLSALRAVPRHVFVPAQLQSEAYADTPLPIGYNQTISQPFIVGYMTEALQLTENARVLEVGTGSGYQAAVLAEVADTVFTIEIIAELAERASSVLTNLGYRNVDVRSGDGYHGWAEEGPFDGILVAAAPDHVPPALIEQLAIGGRLVIPVGSDGRGTQAMTIVTRTSQSHTVETTFPVRFVPMTGRARGTKDTQEERDPPVERLSSSPH